MVAEEAGVVRKPHGNRNPTPATPTRQMLKGPGAECAPAIAPRTETTDAPAPPSEVDAGDDAELEPDDVAGVEYCQVAAIVAAVEQLEDPLDVELVLQACLDRRDALAGAAC